MVLGTSGMQIFTAIRINRSINDPLGTEAYCHEASSRSLNLLVP